MDLCVCSARHLRLQLLVWVEFHQIKCPTHLHLFLIWYISSFQFWCLCLNTQWISLTTICVLLTYELLTIALLLFFCSTTTLACARVIYNCWYFVFWSWYTNIFFVMFCSYYTLLIFCVLIVSSCSCLVIYTYFSLGNASVPGFGNSVPMPLLLGPYMSIHPTACPRRAADCLHGLRCTRRQSDDSKFSHEETTHLGDGSF